MNYKEIVINVPEEGLKDVLIALLANIGYEGFEEEDSHLKAFIAADSFSQDDLAELLEPHGISSTVNDIPQQNWNAVWEHNFDPVIVDDLCVVRAPFHSPIPGAKYEIIITPKMSFGTGHHATTRLMIQQMEDIDFDNKSVFDFGTGTGVLAILAEKMGAAYVLAIDNDEWSYENAQENAAGNNADKVEISMDGIETIDRKFDIILANINRHILLAYMPQLYAICTANGKVIMSGLLNDDKEIIVDAAVSVGFKEVNCKELNGWISLLFDRN